MKKSTLQLRETYLDLREGIRESDVEIATLCEAIENSRDAVRSVNNTQLEEIDLKRKALLKQAISLEQKSGFRVPGIEPILGEWSLKTALYTGNDGNVRRATLVNPDTGLVHDTLRHHKPYLVNNLRLAGDFDLEEILELKRMEWLHNLNLRHTHMGAAGVLALAKSPYLERLQSLDLSFTGTGIQGVEDILKSPNLPKLNTLVLQQKKRGKKPKNYVPPTPLDAKELQEIAISTGRERFKFVLK